MDEEKLSVMDKVDEVLKEIRSPLFRKINPCSQVRELVTILRECGYFKEVVDDLDFLVWALEREEEKLDFILSNIFLSEIKRIQRILREVF